jgi:ribosomal protein RSM22 (predicted rRNA methylase)
VSCLDIGGGTGAAVWAAVDTFPSLAAITVLDQARPALDLGARLAAGSPSAALRGATWHGYLLGRDEGLPKADLVMASYLLGELPDERQRDLVDAMAEAGPIVLLIEPGTPAGYQRIVTARDRLIDRGYAVVAPCVHQLTCPLPVGKDWCHFSARVNRSALHRRIKDAELGYEDEKYSYVIAVRPWPGSPSPDPAQGPGSATPVHAGRRPGGPDRDEAPWRGLPAGPGHVLGRRVLTVRPALIA